MVLQGWSSYILWILEIAGVFKRTLKTTKRVKTNECCQILERTVMSVPSWFLKIAALSWGYKSNQIKFINAKGPVGH